MAQWKLLSNHGQVLLCIASDPGARLRDIAESVGITERAAHRIVTELVTDGYVSRERRGRRNRYTLQRHLPLREPMLQGRKLADVLALLANTDGDGALAESRDVKRSARRA
jgi:DNA-binding IclR family transcriptional regulator